MGTKIYTKAEREQMERASHAKQKHAAMPAEEQTALAKLDGATRALAEIKDAPGAKYVMDIAAAAEHFAKKARLGDEAIKHAQGIKYAAEIKLGEYLKQVPKAKGASAGGTKDGPRGAYTEPRDDAPTLAELGISKKLSAESQRLAELPAAAKAQLGRGEIKPTVALRDQKRSEVSAKIAALPPGKFRVIYADPPWKYGDERAGLEKADTAAAGQYPTMPTSQICELAPNGRHVSDLAAADAVLFMWATFPLLEDGLQVIKAWGFKYKTAFVWDKQRSNIGNYHDARAELLMIATRGSCPIEIDTRPKQVQSIARGKHSVKPEEFRELIESLYPKAIIKDASKERAIELFRRGDAPQGWKIWGNESEAAA
jgi:N6-adenosine-specific RNA methylase IME4